MPLQAVLSTISKTAPTLVNTKPIEAPENYVLKNGDIIDIVGRKFRFNYSNV